MTTALSLLEEMQSFVHVDSATLQKAKTSNINTKNNFDFARVVEDWCGGVYDDDPGYVVSEIEYLLGL